MTAKNGGKYGPRRWTQYDELPGERLWEWWTKYDELPDREVQVDRDHRPRKTRRRVVAGAGKRSFNGASHGSWSTGWSRRKDRMRQTTNGSNRDRASDQHSTRRRRETQQELFRKGLRRVKAA